MQQLQRFYDKAYDWILTVGPRVLLAIGILLVGIWLIRMARRWIKSALSGKRFDPSLRPFLQSLVIIILEVLLVLVIMQVLGIRMTIFAAVIGAFGVAAGLALSGTLQNFASGVIILLLKPYRVGDNIVAQGQEGTVSSIQLFYTVVTTFDNKTVILPNSKLSNEVIINLSRQGKRRLDIELKFNYGNDFEHLKNIIQETIMNSQDVLREPSHRIGVSTIEPDGFKVSVNVWSNVHGFHDTKLSLQQRIIDDLKKGGIKLPGMS